jgi:lipopolysaccharide transport system ATP-binding protein
MGNIGIRFENISKQYRLGNIGTGTLSHDLNRWWLINIRGKEDPYQKIAQVNDRAVKATSDYVWALRNINIDVKQGEVLGIIGKNGAGKSTLLKILSRVTAPTTGRIMAHGRIASLLEVGTGFHPEMTGRENIYMNGSIMGMTKAEITRKMDEIIDFTGIEKYIDTPVKRYSSGMTVRLGFAIAAHLEPEILVVDEVLAVGDAEFQKKAIGKMKDVSRNDGRTVLFVSHNMAAVKSLCSRGVILKDGGIQFEGDIEKCVANYLNGESNLSNHKKWDATPEIHNNDFELLEVGIRALNKSYEEIIRIDESIVFAATFRQKNPEKRIDITLHLKDEEGNKLFSTSSSSIKNNFNNDNGTFMTSVVFPANFFNWGNISIDLYVVEDRRNASLIISDILTFSLSNTELDLGVWMGKEPGALLPLFIWDKTKLSN